MEIKVVENSNLRIDKYLTNYLDISRESILHLIKEGHILVNKKTVKPSYKVLENDEIFIEEIEKDTHNTLKPLDLKLNIVQSVFKCYN